MIYLICVEKNRRGGPREKIPVTRYNRKNYNICCDHGI